MLSKISNRTIYDICILGSGISGMFLAYTLAQDNNRKILMIEMGKKFEERVCPIEYKINNKCISCKICSRIQGFGGLGRSEGKFNYTNDFGGNLNVKIGDELSLKLMNMVDEILCKFGADKIDLYNTENEKLKNIAKENDFKILTTKTRHLGTKLSYEIVQKMYTHLKDKIDIICETEINSITKSEGIFALSNNDICINSKNVVLAMGTSGKDKLKNYCEEFKIDYGKARADIGIRVEMKRKQLESILKYSKETKIYYKCDDYEAFTYCMNPNGRVIKKYQNNMVMADGQNCNEVDNPTANLNFTVFVPRYFNSKEESIVYIETILSSINKNKGRIIIQRFKDLLNNKVTTMDILNKNTVKPTLKADGCNLHNEIPKIYIEGTLSIFKCIEKMIGKPIEEDTLLYGVDVKLYEPEVSTNKHFETKEKGLYIIGDCSGTTYSLSQAAASGIYLGRNLLGY